MSVSTTESDPAIEAAEATTIVVWRGERIPFADVPARIADTDGRAERNALFAGWIQAVDALNSLYVARLAHWQDGGGPRDAPDSGAASMHIERLTAESETVYYAALRRYLAVIDIEQGDATIADLWHIERGTAWGHWFGQREVARAIAEAGREAHDPGHLTGWRGAEAQLVGRQDADMPLGMAVIGELYGSLVGDPEWLGRALRMAPDDIGAYADFAAFIRLWRLRRAMGLVQFENRLLRTDDEALNRAYYAGIVGHITGIDVPEAAYLRDVGRPGASATRLDRSLLAGALAEALEARFGHAWWSEQRARDMVQEFAGADSVRDALARIGYDSLDWRPVLRQIRTRLIGEMSGYGGPNITTRAGTRKV